METFEHYYPDARFARQILMQMINTGTAPARLPPEAQRSFEYPGAANYMKALVDLAHALQKGPLPAPHRLAGERRRERNHGRTGRALLWTAYRRLDLLLRQRPADPKSQAIAHAFWTDADVALLDTDHWLQIADSIEKNLTRQTR